MRTTPAHGCNRDNDVRICDVQIVEARAAAFGVHLLQADSAWGRGPLYAWWIVRITAGRAVSRRFIGIH